MKLLVLGGTVFLSRAVAAEAAARGHDVLCAARGLSGAVPDGVPLARWDRGHPVPAELAGAAPDAVVDVSRIPSHVRRAVAAFPGAHWTFVSTINVYDDVATPGGTPATLPLLDPIETDEDPASGPEVYGGMKVACEHAVRAGTAASVVIRPGLIAGPGDPSGRFTYWPARMAEAAADGGPVLVPEPVDEPVQLIDVRDLARWIVDGAEAGTTGVFDGVGHPVPRSEILKQVADGVGAAPELVPVTADVLKAHDVAPWSGDRSLPLWIGDPDWSGMLAHDASPSYDAGLRTRPVGETARDTLAWLRAEPDAKVTGLTRAEELELLGAVH
ncbi:NAD-dependent epimerase/dehydratase family protein [Myceligenerans pegani]|uniref:Epimerase n=1 Tax=Myceligenerans pegani TaxID=2776917 RepID=A0ABR9MTN4_9MICO|nr:NAD-dependent epimerase/dehydratase family protein [Myceligenerans sp. TRM 65318]MBE1874725.1 epimerase [Myceligenerans sp. TRM 65318]MBE3016996.1 epimerase [Myceligenerans sp. TRM 65318]